MTDPLLPGRTRGLTRGLVLGLILAQAFAPLGVNAQTAAATSARTKAKPAAADTDTVSLNFVNADLEAAVRAVGQFLHKDFVIDPRVKGTVSITTDHPVTRAEAYRLLLASLRFQGYTIVEAGGIAKVLPESDAKFVGGPTQISGSNVARGDQIVTQIFHLNYESASNLVNMLRPLVTSNNPITVNPSSNSLVITDYADNLQRLSRIIASVDAPGSAEADVVVLNNAVASDLAPVVQRLLEPPAGTTSDPGQRVVVIAEPRTNALLLRAASAARVSQAKMLIAKLDQPSASAGNIHMVYLKNADATKLAQTLRSVVSGDTSAPTATQPLSGGSAGLGQTGANGTTTLLGATGPNSTLASAAASLSANPFSAQGGSNSGGGFIQADSATNALIITAPEPVYRNLRAIIDRLDVRRAQVFVESLIVEVTASKAAEFGIQWQALSGYNSNGTQVIGGTNFGTTGTNILTTAQNPGSVSPGLNVGIINGQITIPGIGTITNLGFLARALESDTNTNILSTPNLMTLDNEEASIIVGQNVPFVTGQYAQTGTSTSVQPFQTIERHDVGLTLRVRPQVSDGGTVKMQIYQEVSSLQNALVAGNVVTNKRALTTSVQVDDGQIIVLGGLVQDTVNDGNDQVPFLGNVPVVGNLFKYRTRSHSKTNLMVFLRPYVVRDNDAGGLFEGKYEAMRRAQQSAGLPGTGVLPAIVPPELPPLPPTSDRKPSSASPPQPSFPPETPQSGSAPSGAAPK